MAISLDPASQLNPVIRTRPQPNDANPKGDIFGGWLMSQMDIAGATVARKRAKGLVATVAVKELLFLEPLFVHDLVSFYGEVVAVGRTSLTVHIEVYAIRCDDYAEQPIKISEATLVFVALTAPGQKREIPNL